MKGNCGELFSAIFFLPQVNCTPRCSCHEEKKDGKERVASKKKDDQIAIIRQEDREEMKGRKNLLGCKKNATVLGNLSGKNEQAKS